MSKLLRKPWVAALTTTVLLFAASFVLLRGDRVESGPDTLPALSPSGGEVAMTPGSAVFVFLVVWGLYSLGARSRSRATRVGG